MGPSLEDYPMTLVSSRLTSPQNSKGNIGSEGTEWERGSKNRQFLANKSPYLRNGARWDHGPKEGLIGSRIRACDWYQNHRPWMTLNGQNALWRSLVQKRCVFWRSLHKFEWRQTHTCMRQKCRPVILVSGNNADTRGGSSWRGPQMRVGLLTTAIFGDLSGYCFVNFRDKASNIVWRYAAPCSPVTDCKMNDLE